MCLESMGTGLALPAPFFSEVEMGHNSFPVQRRTRYPSPLAAKAWLIGYGNEIQLRRLKSHGGVAGRLSAVRISVGISPVEFDRRVKFILA
ncbi:MAG: hypothetical protein K0U98_11615 [Deltaproteobacteria bacterium]|nr:hypothetical protein [Deltaproteobacteria bacterium]